MNMNEVLNYISNLTVDDATQILSSLKEQERQQNDEIIKKIVNDHSGYVGKCYYKFVKPHGGMFPEMKKYYKVISERASNEYRLSALTFYEHPFYWFNYQSHRIGLPGDWFLGKFDFHGIEVEDFGAFCFGSNNIEKINDLVSITIKEYNLAMDEYIKELQSMDWVADHYKYGDKLPSDPDWERND